MPPGLYGEALYVPPPRHCGGRVVFLDFDGLRMWGSVAIRKNPSEPQIQEAIPREPETATLCGVAKVFVYDCCFRMSVISNT